MQRHSFDTPTPSLTFTMGKFMKDAFPAWPIALLALPVLVFGGRRMGADCSTQKLDVQP